MDYYKHFFEMVSRYQNWDAMLIYCGICRGLASTDYGTHEQLMDATKAYEDYIEEVKNNEPTSTAI